ncbi:hypothetical protein D3C71_2218920 [compost metagenome]
MHITQAKQCGNIRLMRLSHQGITQEDHQIHLILGDEGSDLLVTTERTRQEAVYIQFGVIHDSLSRCTGRV